MDNHEQSWIRSRAYGMVWDLHADCPHIHHNDREGFEAAVRAGLEAALQSINWEE